MPKVPFAKPPLSPEHQVDLLISRGLTVPDKAQAAHYIQFVGYYRLSGYFRYFADPEDAKRERFRKDVSFERVLNLYIFDRRLRNLMNDALERIEVALKANMSNVGCLHDGPFWLCHAKNFDHGAHGTIQGMLDEAAAINEENKKHVFLKHFYDKYSDHHPPSWMLMEAMSFGPASKIYKVSRGELRLPIAAAFRVQHDILQSWLHALVFARNVCAHHSRLWNRTFTIKPKIPKEYRDSWPADAQDRLYIVACIIQHMMRVIADGSRWGQRLQDLVAGRPNVPLRSMGFPDDWVERDFWKE